MSKQFLLRGLLAALTFFVVASVAVSLLALTSSVVWVYELVLGGAALLILFVIYKVSEQLGDHSERYQSLYYNNADAIFMLDMKGRFTSANPACEVISGFSMEQFLKLNFNHLVYSEDLERANVHFHKALQGERQTYDIAIINRQGQRIELNVRNVPIYVQNRLVGVYGIARDLSENNRLRRELLESKQYYESLFQNSPDAIFALDLEGKFLSLNPAAEYITGYSADQLLNQPFSLLTGQASPGIGLTQALDAARSGNPSCLELTILQPSGRTLWIQVVAVPLHIDQQLAGLIGIAKDVTEHKESQEQIRYMAYHDMLTGLPNRKRFIEETERFIALAKQKERMVAVFFVDLDRFKSINDTLGHQAGDFFLQEAAKRLLQSVNSPCIVSRFSGDEFTVAVTIQNREEAKEIAQSIRERISEPYGFLRQSYYLSPSIGISLYPDDGDETSALIQYADAAMNYVKEHGKNQYDFYKSEYRTAVSAKLSMEQHLREALLKREFELYYQPIVHARTGSVEGLECLIRWESPILGRVAPADFIPIAEETDLISDIGDWVLRTACRQAVVWQQAGMRPIQISVNLSIKQFEQPDFISRIEELLKECGLAPRWLDLEITESMTMDMAKAAPVLNRLKQLGVSVSIDDFGTGYSSLNYIKKLSIDRLKIDQSFIRGLLDSEEDAAIVATIVTLADRLRLAVVAEGVETEQHADCLRALGCDFYQGYFISRPMPAHELERFMQRAMITELPSA